MDLKHLPSHMQQLCGTVQYGYLKLIYTLAHRLGKNMEGFITIKPTRCTNFLKFILEMKHYMFRTVPLSIIRTWYICHRGLLTACEQEHMLLLTSCQQTCMTYTIAVCTVKNSWWWAEELSETCRVSFQE